MPGTMSVGGVISGLKTDDIIAKVMEYARQPQQQIQANKATAQTQLAAWQDLNARVLALKLKSDFLAEPGGFRTNTATSSETSIVTATASDKAQAGTFYLTVNSRAQSHQIGSVYQDGSGNALYNSLDTVVGYGTTHIAFPDGSKYASFDVTTDANNNTLSGLRDSINKANKGVTAAIINRGTTSSPAYQLVLTSNETGTANEMTITKGADWQGGTAPDFTETQANHERTIRLATDAVVVMGDGADKVTITSSTNTINDLIPGVTLNILSSDIAKTIRVDVARDTSSIKAAAQGFVQQFNDLMDAIDKQFQYDAETGEGGPLMSSSELQMLQSDIMGIATQSVPGTKKEWSALSSVGITLGTDGHLKIDDALFTNALNNSPDDVRKLFAYDMQSDSSYVSFLGSTSDTQASPPTGWALSITQAARKPQVTAGVAMDAEGLAQPETLTINGIAINFNAGDTAADVISEINKNSGTTHVTAVLTDSTGTGEGNFLTLKSVNYGSKISFTTKSSVSNTTVDPVTGRVRTTGLGTTEVKPDAAVGEGGLGTGLLGLDVAGTINDGEHVIACTGSGQMLTTAPDDSTKNTPVNGLALLITATAPMDTKVYYTKGVTSTLRDNLIQATSSKGVVTTAQASLNTAISDYDKSITDMEERLQAQQDRLYAQFSAMESQLAKLQDQGNYLAGALGTSTSTKK